MFFLFLIGSICKAQMINPKKMQSVSSNWPSEMSWWKANNLRLIQTNLPAYEANLNVDSLITDLQRFSANVLLINAGGIMAFYPTDLEFQYENPFMQKNMLKDVIEKCHNLDIKVMVRFDFSRIHESIFKEHPDWAYISPKDERILDDDMYTVSVNAPYVQEKSHKIVEEVISKYNIDGIFINMPGYHVRNYYQDKYYGIDQNQHDKRRFSTYSNGMELPTEENPSDPVFKKYEEFKSFTVSDWLKGINTLVKSKSDQIAICTYSDDNVDIIRHESQAHGLPYWPYVSSDNVNNTSHSNPNHIVSNASIQQISFKSRYNAVEPEEIAIRLYENIANGSGLDISTMGDFRDYEDERNYEMIETIFAHHKNFEPYYGKYRSVSEILIISPQFWPGGESAEEYRGIQLMLKEAHIPFDIIEKSKIEVLHQKIKRYRVIILPETDYLTEGAIDVLKETVNQGTQLIATNRSLSHHPEALEQIFGAKVIDNNYNGSGNYVAPENKNIFKSFDKQSMLFWEYNLGQYDFSGATERFLPILAKGRPGPPEKIGGHDLTGYYGMGVKQHSRSKAVLLPINIGRLYYLKGYEQHKNILLDVLDYAYPESKDIIKTNAHPRIETVLKNYTLNTPENANKTTDDGKILHLVNLTGFGGTSYFNYLPVFNVDFTIKSDFEPSSIFSMGTEEYIEFTWDKGYIHFVVPVIGQYEGLVIKM